MSLNQVTNIQDGDETFELWSTEDGSTWELRKPTPSPGDPAYSAYGILASGGEGLDLTSPRVVVRNNIYVNNYTNADLSLDAKNQALTLLESRAGFNNISYGFEGEDTPPPPPETDNNEFQGASNQELQERISENYKGLHSSDRFLQRLSLKNLKYPLDADYGNTQDYIQINQFTYQATSPSILFGGSDSITEFGNILESGLKMETPKEKVVGLVKLPMPNDLTDSNNVAWGEDQLNAITAAAATLASGGVSGGLKILEDIGNKDINLLQGLSQALTGSIDGLGKAVGQARTAFENNKDAELLGRSVLGSGLLNLAGFGLSPEAILARGAGIIPNSNLQLLFNAPTLRAFRFNWKMSPRSQEEATRINNIIRFFKQGMAVKKRKGSGAGGASYFLATPNVFDISFRTSKTNTEINNRNHSVLRMKTCACVGAAVNYTPQGMWNAYEKGQPTSSILSLQFKELEPVYNTDYEEDPFEYDDLTGFVPENAVGY